MRAAAILLVAGLVLVSPLSPRVSIGAPQSDFLIVPGQRVGHWELGRPLETYRWGSPRASWKWRDPAQGIHIVDGYNYLAGPSGPSVNIHTCKDDPRVIQIVVHRWTTLPPSIEAEAFKFRTADGIGIGSDEADIMRIHGRPTVTIEWTERHGATDISAVGYTYLPPGLVFLVNRGNKKVFGLGAEAIDGWPECSLRWLGGWKAARRADLTVFTSGVPLPRNLQVIPPGPDVPREQAVFAGKWIGSWSGAFSQVGTHILVVEEIQYRPGQASRATVVWAQFWSGGRYIGEWHRVSATLSRNLRVVLPVTIEGQNNYIYERQPDGTLWVDWPETFLQAVLRRMND